MSVKFDRRALMFGAGSLPLLATAVRAQSQETETAPLAPTPPMGWNSWNSFATTITEAQAKENAAIMADKLLPSGYDVFTVDIQWYEPNATGYDYRPGAELTMDEYGRLWPAPNRFPSSANGAGFRPLADHVHSLGLKFGVHLMRGIPRLAYARNLRVFGTDVRAREIANPNSTCTWNTDMYGVDMSKDGAQAYYNSVFSLFAEWGVDFVKVDDLSRPYSNNWAEVEAIRQAMNQSGRPMILSLSPGETDLKWAAHVRDHAQMWRISDDFWDEWKLLHEQFKRLENWNPYRKTGAWPDADMLPLGMLAMGNRQTRFTPDEQQTLMTLWAIARSPLIMGGDLRHLDAATLSLLTHPEVIRLNQHSRDNRPVSNDGAGVVWTARDDGGHYVALFNISDAPLTISQPLKALNLPTRLKARNLWTGESLGDIDTTLTIALNPHACALYYLS